MKFQLLLSFTLLCTVPNAHAQLLDAIDQLSRIALLAQFGSLAGVLNADDPNVAAIAEYCEGLLTYFSQDPQGALITAHLAAGKRAVLLDSDEIVLAQGEQRTLLCSVATLPVLSASQAARHENMVPVLASVAAAWALNLPLDLIRSGLRSF